MIAPATTDNCAICGMPMPWSTTINVSLPQAEYITCNPVCFKAMMQLAWMQQRTTPPVSMEEIVKNITQLAKQQNVILSDAIRQLYSAAGGP